MSHGFSKLNESEDKTSRSSSCLPHHSGIVEASSTATVVDSFGGPPMDVTQPTSYLSSDGLSAVDPRYSFGATNTTKSPAFSFSSNRKPSKDCTRPSVVSVIQRFNPLIYPRFFTNFFIHIFYLENNDWS